MKSQWKALMKYIKKKIKIEKQIMNETRVNNINNPRKSWNAVKGIMNEHGRIESNPENISNIINDYFIYKTNKLRESTSPAQVDHKERIKMQIGNKLENVPEYNLHEIDTRIFRKVMKESKGGTASGHTTIDGNSLKIAAPILEDAMIHFINLSIRECKFATMWKHLTIHPRFKKGDPCLKENQRPVAHIEEMGKVTERVVAEQMLTHMHKHGLLSKDQHGATKHHSPTTATTTINEQLLHSAKNKKLASLLLIDLTAAYDLIDRDILEEKLDAYRFGDTTRTWMKSYLMNRTQEVEVSGKKSTILRMEVFRADCCS